MAVWIIADTHLSSDGSKPMDVFGPGWINHQERLARHCAETIGPEDSLIIGGDISWALHPQDAVEDLRFIHELPGRRKILLRGNHDYWWTTKAKTERLFGEEGLGSLELLQNDALLIDDRDGALVLMGTRGWTLPFDEGFGPEDEKIYRRELSRLKLSANAALKLEASSPEKYPIIAVMHFPPLSREGRASEFCDILEACGVSRCYYGHVHGNAGKSSYQGEHKGIIYANIACDRLNCCPQKIEL